MPTDVRKRFTALATWTERLSFTETTRKDGQWEKDTYTVTGQFDHVSDCGVKTIEHFRESSHVKPYYQFNS